MSRIQIAATILSALVLGTRFTVVELIGFVYQQKSDGLLFSVAEKYMKMYW